MNYRILATFALALLSVGSLLAADTPIVTATASKTSVQVAEPFWIDLSVTAPAGTSVTFPSIGDKLGSFDVIDTRDMFDVPNADKPDQRIWSRKVRLESIDTGDLAIPSLDIQVAERATSRVFQTQPISIHVVSVLEGQADPTQYRDIQSVIDVVTTPPRSNRWAWVGLAGFAILAATTAAVVAMVRRKPWMTPRDWALGKLDQLEVSMANTAFECEAAATELSSITRDYLQLQFSLAEPGRTATELLNTMQTESLIPESAAAKLRALFELADKVKFAGIKLSREALVGATHDLRSIIASIADDLQTKTQPADLSESN